jgi:peroxiredoxin
MKAALVVLVLALAGPGCAKMPEPKIGAPAPAFGLSDQDGKPRSLSDYKDKVVVLEWLNYDCPFVRKHYNSRNMQGLQKEYTGKGVVWLSIISSAKGKQGNYPPEEVRKKNEERGGQATAILLDGDGKVGKLYGAKSTPTMVVIDQKGVLQYEGAIDDKPSTDVEDVPGARNYVREALDAVLAGKPVKTARTKSYGCSVKY